MYHQRPCSLKSRRPGLGKNGQYDLLYDITGIRSIAPPEIEELPTGLMITDGTTSTMLAAPDDVVPYTINNVYPYPINNFSPYPINNVNLYPIDNLNDVDQYVENRMRNKTDHTSESTRKMSGSTSVKIPFLIQKCVWKHLSSKTRSLLFWLQRKEYGEWAAEAEAQVSKAEVEVKRLEKQIGAAINRIAVLEEQLKEAEHEREVRESQEKLRQQTETRQARIAKKDDGASNGKLEAYNQACKKRRLLQQHENVPDSPTKRDVLCGRGGAIMNHEGNKVYRELINHYKPSYLAAPKGEKIDMSSFIVAHIRQNNGRFLKKSKTDNLWYDIGDAKAVEKTSSALREKLPDSIRNNNKTASGANKSDNSKNMPSPSRSRPTRSLPMHRTSSSSLSSSLSTGNHTAATNFDDAIEAIVVGKTEKGKKRSRLTEEIAPYNKYGWFEDPPLFNISTREIQLDNLAKQCLAKRERRAPHRYDSTKNAFGFY